VPLPQTWISDRRCRGWPTPARSARPAWRLRQQPGLLTRREPGQQPVVDLAGHREATERRRRQEEPRVVGKAVRGRVDVTLDRRDHAVAVLVDVRDLGLVGVEQALRERGAWFERRDPDVGVEQHLVGKAAGDEAHAELALRVVVAVELVGIAREERTVAEGNRVVRRSGGSGPRDDRLQRTDLARFERARDAAGERELVRRMDPVGGVVEFPVGVHVALLDRIVGAHAQLTE
jgi:hypothetical protein